MAGARRAQHCLDLHLTHFIRLSLVSLDGAPPSPLAMGGVGCFREQLPQIWNLLSSFVGPKRSATREGSSAFGELLGNCVVKRLKIV